ncbi:uncharacterized protein LOC107003845 [Solanum pennellii]|uniref:Uncharacterized protein LOC107003845 n=1 Tax=Solanum pennellii TaxID=28526 RepID=A0ABM1FJ33_SOLPN|nr:uncharacterized protein LOC107003845 [Solanum pennellii]
MNVHQLLVIGDSDLLIHQVQGEWAVKNPNIIPYVQYVQKLCKRFRKIEFRYTPRIHNELADALATIASTIKHPDTNYIDPLDIELKEHVVHCSHVEAEPDGFPWYFDIKKYLESGTYPEDATANQKKSIRRMALTFFLSREVIYRRNQNLVLLRCVDAVEAARLIEQIHAGVCGTHMSGLTLARKILRAGYFWMTMENDYCMFVQKCHKCQVHDDLIRVPPHKLNAMSSPWPFVAWGMDVIDPIEPAALNGHRFILNPSLLIIANLNSHLMRDICQQFEVTHRNSTAYRAQMNGAVEAANKNIKKILRKMIDKHPVIPAEVEIPSLRIIQEAELSNAEWLRKRIDQLTLIDEKRMVDICHGQLYRKRMVRAIHKRVRARIFKEGQLVLKRIFPHQDEYKKKFAPNWKGAYMVREVLSGGALLLSEMDGTVFPKLSTRSLSRDTICVASVYSFVLKSANSYDG